MRFIVDVTMRDKSYVIVNMDETSIQQMAQVSQGYVAFGARRKRGDHRYRPRRTDRTDVKTSLMGVVCDSPDLQVYLPQVFLPKYTQNANPPRWALNLFGQQGFPLQFWHGSNGSSTPTIMRQWMNAVRSCVHSYNPEIWIVMILDCHSSHLDMETVRHMNTLGIVPIFIPARLTWLLQPLDVYVYAHLKRVMRQLLANASYANPVVDGAAGQWIGPACSATKLVLSRTDWSEQFARLGAGITFGDMSSAVQKYLGRDLIYPRLPCLAEFATMLNRCAHTETTVEIHRALVQPAIRVERLPSNAMPPRGAVHEMPRAMPATKRRRTGTAPTGEFDAVIREFLLRQEPIDPLGGIVGPEAVQVLIHRPAA